MIGGEEGDYVLRVRGESMKDAGILEGDYVIVRPADDADDGEIVVALIGEEATVKRFFREADHIRLQPENDAMEPIRTTTRGLGRSSASSEGLSRSTSCRRHERRDVGTRRRAVGSTLEDVILGAGRTWRPAARRMPRVPRPHARRRRLRGCGSDLLAASNARRGPDAVPVGGPSDRGGRENPSRKVRTPKGRAVGNAHPGKPAGKCHRNDTADGAATRESRTGKGEMVR